jgi:hypothetical protein
MEERKKHGVLFCCFCLFTMRDLGRPYDRSTVNPPFLTSHPSGVASCVYVCVRFWFGHDARLTRGCWLSPAHWLREPFPTHLMIWRGRIVQLHQDHTKFTTLSSQNHRDEGQAACRLQASFFPQRKTFILAYIQLSSTLQRRNACPTQLFPGVQGSTRLTQGVINNS